MTSIIFLPLLVLRVTLTLPVSHGAFTTTSKPATPKLAIEQRAETAAEPNYANEGFRTRYEPGR